MITSSLRLVAARDRWFPTSPVPQFYRSSGSASIAALPRTHAYLPPRWRQHARWVEWFWALTPPTYYLALPHFTRLYNSAYTVWRLHCWRAWRFGFGPFAARTFTALYPCPAPAHLHLWRFTRPARPRCWTLDAGSARCSRQLVPGVTGHCDLWRPRPPPPRATAVATNCSSPYHWLLVLWRCYTLFIVTSGLPDGVYCPQPSGSVDRYHLCPTPCLIYRHHSTCTTGIYGYPPPLPARNAAPIHAGMPVPAGLNCARRHLLLTDYITSALPRTRVPLPARVHYVHTFTTRYWFVPSNY